MVVMVGIIKNRKAISSIVNRLIIFSIVAIILLLLYVSIFSFIGGVKDREVCRTSVYAKFGAKTATTGIYETSINLQCYTQKLRITRNGVFKKGKSGDEAMIADFNRNILIGGAIFGFGSSASREDKIERNNQRVELVKRVIANEMYDCWDQFGQGKLPFWTGGERRCIICSEITFESDWLDVDGLEAFPEEMAKKDIIPDFGGFLNTQKIAPNNPDTYSDFYPGKFEEDFIVNTKVDTNIVFKSIGKSWLEANFLSILGGEVFGCALGGAGGLAVAITIAAGGPIGWIAGGVALTIMGAGCVVGVVSGGVVAVSQGGEWAPAMVVGPEGLVSSKCSRLY